RAGRRTRRALPAHLQSATARRARDRRWLSGRLSGRVAVRSRWRRNRLGDADAPRDAGSTAPACRACKAPTGRRPEWQVRRGACLSPDVSKEANGRIGTAHWPFGPAARSFTAGRLTARRFSAGEAAEPVAESSAPL